MHDRGNPKRRRGAALAGLVLLLVVSAATPLAQPGQAQSGEGLGITPPAIAIADAQPGQTYVRPVSVQNQFDSSSTMTVEPDGASGAWATTDPGSGFTIPPRSARQVDVRITVPTDAGPGSHLGQVRFTTEAKQSPNGSGTAVRTAVAVLLNVTVAGEPRVHLAWLDARAADVDPAAAPHGNATVLNDGNVAATARATATVRAQSSPGGAVLASGGGELRLEAGATGQVELVFADRLPVGQYVMHVASEDGTFARDVPFKVAAGGLAPQALLRGIQHVPRAQAGQLVRLDGLFSNTGTLPITSAQLHAEARDASGVLLQALTSEAVAVPAGATVNLTVYWTPPGAGTYHVVGHANYDGFMTPDVDSPLNVDAAAVTFPWLWLAVGAAVLLIVVLLIVLARRRRRHRAGAGPGKPRP